MITVVNICNTGRHGYIANSNICNRNPITLVYLKFLSTSLCIYYYESCGCVFKITESKVVTSTPDNIISELSFTFFNCVTSSADVQLTNCRKYCTTLDTVLFSLEGQNKNKSEIQCHLFVTF